MCLKSLKNISAAIIVVSVIASCSVNLYEPSPETVAADVDLSKLKQGKELYINNCSKCHSLDKPEKYTEQQWVKLMKIMKKKAKINDKQASLILQYVTKGKKR